MQTLEEYERREEKIEDQKKRLKLLEQYMVINPKGKIPYEKYKRAYLDRAYSENLTNTRRCRGIMNFIDEIKKKLAIENDTSYDEAVRSVSDETLIEFLGDLNGKVIEYNNNSNYDLKSAICFGEFDVPSGDESVKSAFAASLPHRIERLWKMAHDAYNKHGVLDVGVAITAVGDQLRAKYPKIEEIIRSTGELIEEQTIQNRCDIEEFFNLDAPVGYVRVEDKNSPSGYSFREQTEQELAMMRRKLINGLNRKREHGEIDEDVGVLMDSIVKQEYSGLERYKKLEAEKKDVDR